MKSEWYKGKKWDDIMQAVKNEYSTFEVVHTKVHRKFPFFWEKEWEVEVKGSPKTKKEQTKPKDMRRAELLSILEREGVDAVGEKAGTSPSPTGTKGKDDKELESMKAMIEKLVSQLETEKKGFLSQEEEQVLRRYYLHLRQMEVEDGIARQVMQEVKETLRPSEYLHQKKVDMAVRERIEGRMRVNGELDIDQTNIIALIGPTGVGKTTTLAKIAGILMNNNKRIGLITTDVYRIGATEQLQIYANILESKMIAVTNPEELKDAIDYYKNVEKVDHVLIDTVGRNPMDMDLVNDVKTYLDIAKPDHTGLVLSSTQKYSDMKKIVQNFDHVNIDSLLFTKLDETRSYGSMLNMMVTTDYRISYVTDGQIVPQDIYLASSNRLTNKILTGVNEDGSSSFSA